MPDGIKCQCRSNINLDQVKAKIARVAEKLVQAA